MDSQQAEDFAARWTAAQPAIAAFVRSLVPDLTSAEEVLQRVAAGGANKIIAGELNISEETVKGHMRSILAKLNANDRLDAVLIAMRRGILDA